MKPLFHPNTKKQIERLISSPSHAISIVGETGAGKGFAADYIASTMLKCTMEHLKAWPYIKKLACSQDAVGIEQIREIQQFLTLIVPGDHSIRRALILENIEALGREAQNALLKTLEEAPADTVIIATIARRDYALPTIHSRLQQITLQPISMDAATNYFAKDFNPKNVERAYFISNGYIGLLSAILTAQDSHPLVVAIAQAKTALSQSRYERLLDVDSLVKNKETSSRVFLDGLYRLLYASYKQAVIKGKLKGELSRSLSRLHLVEQAVSDLDNKVSEKLVLSRLFFSL
jgi:DNA polymerase III delta prime subunit